MTKDDQIAFLLSVLISIRDNHFPLHGDNAVEMQNEAHKAVSQFKYGTQSIQKEEK